MDPAERIARACLIHMGHGDPVFEPDGNIPPDFLIDGRVAVEVRRLNQNVQDENGTWRGLEEVDIPLLQSIRRSLADLGPREADQSWYVSYRFRRPIAAPRQVSREITTFLTAFRERPEQQQIDADLPCGLHISLRPTEDRRPSEFVLASYTDRDSGGWLLHEIGENLKICIADKTRKVAAYRSRYDQWWLVFIDMIGWGLSEFDRELFKNAVRIEHNWDRVILVDPRDPTRWFQVESSAIVGDGQAT